jgi:hypothetical protein
MALDEWHWARDAQLGEDSDRYTDRTGVAVFSFRRTVVMNLLRQAATARFAKACVSSPTPSREYWRWEA